LSNYSNVTLQADVAIDSTAAVDTVGFFTNINSASNQGNVVLFCPQSSTTFDVRIGGQATPTVAGGGSTVPNPSTVSFGSGYWLNSTTGTGPITTLTGGNTFTSGSFYTLQLLTTQNTAADTVRYKLNVFNSSGTLIGNYDSGIISGVNSVVNTAGQVGVFTRDRSTTGTTHIKNMFINSNQ